MIKDLFEMVSNSQVPTHNIYLFGGICLLVGTSYLYYSYRKVIRSNEEKVYRDAESQTDLESKEVCGVETQTETSVQSIETQTDLVKVKDTGTQTYQDNNIISRVDVGTQVDPDGTLSQGSTLLNEVVRSDIQYSSMEVQTSSPSHNDEVTQTNTIDYHSMEIQTELLLEEGSPVHYANEEVQTEETEMFMYPESVSVEESLDQDIAPELVNDGPSSLPGHSLPGQSLEEGLTALSEEGYSPEAQEFMNEVESFMSAYGDLNGESFISALANKFPEGIVDDVRSTYYGTDRKINNQELFIYALRLKNDGALKYDEILQWLRDISDPLDKVDVSSPELLENVDIDNLITFGESTSQESPLSPNDIPLPLSGNEVPLSPSEVPLPLSVNETSPLSLSEVPLPWSGSEVPLSPRDVPLSPIETSSLSGSEVPLSPSSSDPVNGNRSPSYLGISQPSESGNDSPGGSTSYGSDDWAATIAEALRDVIDKF